MSVHELFEEINKLEADSAHIDSAIDKVKKEEEKNSSTNEKNILARTYSL
ncbi:hypothetical protein ACVTNF_003814 [Photobacterium damselae]